MSVLREMIENLLLTAGHDPVSLDKSTDPGYLPREGGEHR